MSRFHTTARRLAASPLAACLWMMVTAPVHAGPASDELQINQLTTGDQQSPDVAATPDGGFLVVWQSPVSPGDDVNLAVVGRRLDAAGAPATDDFQVNTSTSNSQRRPRVSSRGDGSFVVLWETFFQGGKGTLNALQARPFDSAGNGAAEDFSVAVSPNINTTINTHDVGAASGSDFVVVYSRFYYYNGTYSGSVHKRRLEADGTVIDSGILATESGREIGVRAAGGDAIGFVVSTHSREYFGQYNDTRVLRLDPSGTTVGSTIEVHGDQPFGFGGGTSADAALSPSGDFVVAWDGYDTYEGTQSEIYGRRVDSGDLPDLAGPQVLNGDSAGFQRTPRLARGADGSFLLVWESPTTPGDDGLGLRGRWLASDGSPSGDEFAVNVYTTGTQRSPEIAASADGRSFLVVWNSTAGTGDVDG